MPSAYEELRGVMQVAREVASFSSPALGSTLVRVRVRVRVRVGEGEGEGEGRVRVRVG